MITFIDTNNLLKRIYHGGEYPYTMWMGILRKALSNSAVEVVCDTTTSKKYRQAICGRYKEGRNLDIDPIFYQIYNDCIDMASLMGAKVVKVDNGEADDYIISQAKEGDQVFSNDRDLWVLLGKSVKIYVQANTPVTPEMLWQKFKTNNPDEVTLYKSLVGDPSDNIPGKRGFGAAAWDKLDQAKKDELFSALRNGEDHPFLTFESKKSFELVSLCTDVQVSMPEPLTGDLMEYITRKGIVC